MEGKPKSQEISEDHFLKIRNDAEEKYKKLNQIHCPYFKEKVNFNIKGLDHIKFKTWNKPRGRFDQYLRLKLLYLAPTILERSHTVQGIWQRKEWERRKRHGVWEKVMIDVNYYEFVAVIGKARLKVIIKELVGGAKFFWTLIPFWKTNSVTNSRILHESDTEKEIGDGDY